MINMQRDRAGNTLQSASKLRNLISKSLVRQDTITTADLDDLYSFRLKNRSRFNLALSNLNPGRTLELELFRLKRPKNQVLQKIGRVNFSDLTPSRLKPHLQQVARFKPNAKRNNQLDLSLNSGEYYIRIFRPQGTTRRKLSLTTAPGSIAPLNLGMSFKPYWGNSLEVSDRPMMPLRTAAIQQPESTALQQKIRYQLRVSVTPEIVQSSDLTPPVNPYLGNSPWSTYHRNSYAQASTLLRGPEPGDRIEVQFIRNPSLTTSPWLQLSEAYPSGERAFWGSSLTDVYKGVMNGNQFEIVDSYRIDDSLFTVNWNLILLKGNQVLVPDPESRRLLLFGDSDPTNSRSPIALKNSFNLPDSAPGKFVHVNVTYDGWIVVLTDEGYLVSVRNDLSEYRTFHLPLSQNEVNYHNAFSIDEEGGLYFVTTQAMTRINWDGNQFSLDWQVPYDFRGTPTKSLIPGNAAEFLRFLRGEEGTGSGTTPTLMGFGDMDKLVLVADGKTPNNLIAFWRDEIPADWAGLPGYDRRVAAVTPLPYSTPEGEGFTAENSPTAWGYDIAIAQYNGFQPDENPLNGVQKLRWNPITRTLDLAWATDAVNFNNVLTYSNGSNLVYGSGRRDGVYYFWGLDWQTGEIRLEVPLGNSPNFLDQGNQVTLNDDRSVIFSTATGIVRILPSG